MAVPRLLTWPGGARQGSDQHAPAGGSKDRSQDEHQHAQRVTPLDAEQKGAGRDQDEHLNHPGHVDAEDLADQHLGAGGGRDQQARQGADCLFRQDGTPAIADGIHQEHQRHSGGHVCHRIESFLRLAGWQTGG